MTGIRCGARPGVGTSPSARRHVLERVDEFETGVAGHRLHRLVPGFPGGAHRVQPGRVPVGLVRALALVGDDVDIGAIEMIHTELMRMRDSGHAVLLVSTELDEVLRLSDRVLVMYSGQMSKPVPAAEADRNSIGRLMTSRSDTRQAA